MDIGDSLRRVRESRGLSLREVGERAGLSPSFVGQVERNETSPSMRSLKSITDALGVRLTDLLKDLEEIEESDLHLTTPEMRRRLDNVFSGVEMYVLSPDNGGKMQALMVVARPGGSTGGMFTHQGEEFAMLLSGTLWMQIGDKEYYLRQGDTISFESSVPHRWENRGVLPCVCLWVMTPPSW